MLTKADLTKLKEIFVTRDEFKEELYTRLDAVMGELKAIREEIAASLYRQREHSDQLENHEMRLTKLESVT